MIQLIPDRHSIALNSIDLVFEAMEEEAHADLSGSLHRYLSVCGKSIGAQLITGYLASKNQIGSLAGLPIFQPKVMINRVLT